MEKNIENLIEELTKVRPEMLNEEALKLFNTIMAILDERDKLKKENIKLREHVHFKVCKNCNKEFKCKRNDAKYCKECSSKVNNSNWYKGQTEEQKEKRKEQARLSMQKLRAKKKELMEDK